MVKRQISYGRQTINENDIEAVTEALRSGLITQGPLVEKFEEALCDYTGAKYAVVCSNGTAALHLACLAAGIGPGDSVLTSPLTFIASANCAAYTGAKPVFADIDSATLNIDPVEVEKKFSADPSIKAVIPVHFAGLPCDLEKIRKIARANKAYVIDDACHALGARWKDSRGRWHKVGSQAYSDMTVFSFHPVKSITTCEGGAVLTNDRKLYEKLKSLRTHGVVKDRAKLRSGHHAPWYYEMQSLGFNYRLSDIQCALGISQLKRLDSFIARRREISTFYTSVLGRFPFISTPAIPKNRKSAHHLYPALIDFDGLGVCKSRWFDLMKIAGINPQVHYMPVHLHPWYAEKYGYKWGDFPNAEAAYDKEVSLPVYPLLTNEEAGAVVEAIISSIACAATHRRSANCSKNAANG